MEWSWKFLIFVSLNASFVAAANSLIISMLIPAGIVGVIMIIVCCMIQFRRQAQLEEAQHVFYQTRGGVIIGTPYSGQHATIKKYSLASQYPLSELPPYTPYNTNGHVPPGSPNNTNNSYTSNLQQGGQYTGSPCQYGSITTSSANNSPIHYSPQLHHISPQRRSPQVHFSPVHQYSARTESPQRRSSAVTMRSVLSIPEGQGSPQQPPSFNESAEAISRMDEQGACANVHLSPLHVQGDRHISPSHVHGDIPPDDPPPYEEVVNIDQIQMDQLQDTVV